MHEVIETDQPTAADEVLETEVIERTDYANYAYEQPCDHHE